MGNHLRAKTNAKGKISYYFGDFYCGRRGRKKVSLKTRDESSARQKFTEYERKFMAGLWDPWTDPVDEEGVTVAEAIERFLKDRERTSSAGVKRHLLLRSKATDNFTHPRVRPAAGSGLVDGHFVLPSVSSSSRRR